MLTREIPFQDLAQRIQRQEAELAKLRDELLERQTTLAELTLRKEELIAEIMEIDVEIEAVGQGGPSTISPVKAAAPKTSSTNSGGKVTLPTFLIEIMEIARRPLSIKEIHAEVVRRKFPTSSKNLAGMVQTRVYDLARKGLIQRSEDRSGFVLAETSAQSRSVIAGVSGKISEAREKTSLHQVLTQVLSQSQRPLSAQELADLVLANGYQTKSKDFKNVIWVSIKKMDDIERVDGQGYRLKKGKSSGKWQS